MLSGKKRPKSSTKSFHKDIFFTKKAQEMFNNLYTKGDMSKLKPKVEKGFLSMKIRRLKKKNMNFKKILIGNSNYMRDLVIKKNKTNIHCFDTDTFITKNKKLLKKIKESNSFSNFLNTYGNMMDIKKVTFFDTGKYDIPLLTEQNVKNY